jgi:hypothetical protein
MTLIVAQLVKKCAVLLWDQEAHYLVHKSPTLGLILNQKSSAHNILFCFIEINLKYYFLVYSSTLRSPKCTLSFRVSD